MYAYKNKELNKFYKINKIDCVICGSTKEFDLTFTDEVEIDNKGEVWVPDAAKFPCPYLPLERKVKNGEVFKYKVL